MFVSAVGQFFCTVACMTQHRRMSFAFSRDGAMPGAKHFAQLNSNRVPANAVIAGRDLALILTLPALIKVDINGSTGPGGVLRGRLDRGDRALPGLRDPDLPPVAPTARSFQVGSWNNGNKYKWMNPIAVVEIVIMSICRMLPIDDRAANLVEDEFAWKFVNYASS